MHEINVDHLVNFLGNERPQMVINLHEEHSISMAHGYNLGAVIAKPQNGSGLHSHTTAEVFLIYSGSWRFYWGAEGKDEIVLNAGDIISMPTNMFRAFKNVGKEDGLIFVVLGGDDPGIITWVPDVLMKAKKSGMALLDDNSLIDLSENKMPEGKKILEPISNDEIKKFDNYKLNDLKKFVSKFENRSIYENNLGNGIDLIQILGKQFVDKSFTPVIDQNTGFNLSILKAKKGSLKDLIFNKPTILFSQKGSWNIEIQNSNIKLNLKDTFSIPINTKLNISIDGNEDSYLNCVSKI